VNRMGKWAALALLVLGVAACGSGTTLARDGVEIPAASSAMSGAVAGATGSPADGTIPFGKTAVFDELGLHLTVVSVKRYRPAPSAAGVEPGQVAFAVVVKAENVGAGRPIDMNGVTMTATSGKDGVQASNITDSARRVTGFEGFLTKGQPRTATFGFAADPGDVGPCSVQLRVGFSDVALFAGTIR
jgi:hypothetical protein